MYGYQEVIPGLFIGSRFIIHSSSLASAKVTHLLSVDNFQDFPIGFQTKTLDIADEEDEDIAKHFEDCIDFMGDHRVFVFCTAGRSRSATVVAAFLMKTRKMSAAQALATIRKVRDVRPNPGFLRQLDRYERQLCELCALEKKTEWIQEHKDFVCLLCEQCDLPMVVAKNHSNEASAETKALMTKALSDAAEKYIGKEWYIDSQQRSVPHHLHWHARPRLFKI